MQSFPTGLAATLAAAGLMLLLRCAAGLLAARWAGLPSKLVATATRVATLLALGQALFATVRLQGPALLDATSFAAVGICVFVGSGRLPLALVVATLASAVLHGLGA